MDQDLPQAGRGYDRLDGVSRTSIAAPAMGPPSRYSLRTLGRSRTIVGASVPTLLIGIPAKTLGWIFKTGAQLSSRRSVRSAPGRRARHAATVVVIPVDATAAP